MTGVLQEQDLVYLIYCGIALGVLLLFTGITQLASRRENRKEARSRRMRMIAEGKSTAELLALLKPQAKAGVLSRLPFIGDLPKLLNQAGATMRAPTFLCLCAALSFVVFVIAARMLDPLQATAVAVGGGLFVPVFLLRYRRTKRMDTMVRQLPDALDLMSRGLKVGHPLNTSIGAVASSMPDPVGTEFGLVFDQVNYGDELIDAFAEFAERVEIEEVSYLSASIGIQHGTGGNLASVIDAISRTIRNRISMRRKIRAISSEGRTTAWFLSALPFVIFGFTSYASPGYYADVMDDPLFKPMAMIVIVLTIVNAIVLRKLVSFRI